jgi:O-antigen/teichoic acid export membrane protein
LLRLSIQLNVISYFVLAVVFINGVVSSNLLGPAEKGVLAYILAIYNIAVVVCCSGLRNEALLQLKEGNRLIKQQIYTYNVLLLVLGLGVACFIDTAVFRLVIVNIIVVVVINNFSYEYLKQENYLTLSIIRLICPLIILTLMIVWPPSNAYSFILLMSIGNLFYAVLNHRLLSGINFRSLSLNVGYIVKGFKLGFVLILSNVLYRTELFVIQYSGSAAEVGLYSVANSFSELVFQIPQAVALVVFSKSVNNDRAVKSFIPVVFLVTLVASVVYSFAVYHVYPILFSIEFLPSRDYFLYLIPGTAIFSVTILISNYLIPKGFLPQIAKALLAMIVMKVTINTLILNKFGLEGMLLSASVLYCAFTLYFVRLMVKNG